MEVPVSKWEPGKKVVDIFNSEVATILVPPSGTSDYCIYVEWEDGTRGWVSKDEVRRL